MRYKRLLTFLLPAVAVGVALICRRAPAQVTYDRVIRLAELEIDPTQLDAYKAALKEEIDASIRLERGVLICMRSPSKTIRHKSGSLRCTRVMRRTGRTCRRHILFRYKSATAGMVKSLTLLETEPVRLGAKPVSR